MRHGGALACSASDVAGRLSCYWRPPWHSAQLARRHLLGNVSASVAMDPARAQSCRLTTHSSRTGFARRLNSSVRRLFSEWSLRLRCCPSTLSLRALPGSSDRLGWHAPGMAADMVRSLPSRNGKFIGARRHGHRLRVGLGRRYLPGRRLRRGGIGSGASPRLPRRRLRVSSRLTTHSSRTCFAGRLNSSVRAH